MYSQMSRPGDAFSRPTALAAFHAKSSFAARTVWQASPANAMDLSLRGGFRPSPAHRLRSRAEAAPAAPLMAAPRGHAVGRRRRRSPEARRRRPGPATLRRRRRQPDYLFMTGRATVMTTGRQLTAKQTAHRIAAGATVSHTGRHTVILPVVLTACDWPSYYNYNTSY